MAKQRNIPVGMELVKEFPYMGQVVYADRDARTVMRFTGKRSKPDFYHRYSEQRFEGQLQFVLEDIQRHEVVAEMRAKAVLEVKIGDVFVCSWGYDQTNIDYYEVVKVSASGKSVQVREIGKENTYTGDMQGRCIPDQGNFIGPVMTKQIKAGYEVGSVMFTVNSYSRAFIKRKVDVGAGVMAFESDNWTAYA